MLDGFAVVFFALAGALPAGFAAYRHGYWKGKREGRAENLVAACGLGDVVPGGLFHVPGSVPDPLAVPDVASSPAPLAGVGGVAGARGVAGRAVPMLADPVDGFLETLVMSEFSRMERDGLRIERDCELTLARRVARRVWRLLSGDYRLAEIDVPMLTDEGGGTGARPVSQTPLDTDTPIR